MQLVTFERRETQGGPDHPEARAKLAEVALAFETLEFSRPGTQRLGALIPPGPRSGDVIDLNRALAAKLALEDVGAPEAEADSLLPSDMLLFLRHGANALEQARIAFTWAIDALERYDAPDLVRASVALPRRGVKLCAPVPRPGKLIAIKHNYVGLDAAHGKAAHRQPPEFHLEAPSSVIGPDDEIVIPSSVSRLDYGGGLAVVIGRTARGVSAEEALDFVAGYTAVNDLVALGGSHGQRSVAGSRDTFTPLGPALLTADGVSDPQDLSLRTTVSGTLRQDARTKEMIHPVSELIAFASGLMTLEAGDLLLTGTPAGTGASSDPPRLLRDGDVVDVEIDRIGRLRNYVRSEAVAAR